MSLPSGLLFYLDYTYGTMVGGDSVHSPQALQEQLPVLRRIPAGQSIYNLPTGRGVQSGSLAVGGMYDLIGATYSKVHNRATGANANSVSLWSIWTGAANDNQLVDGAMSAPQLDLMQDCYSLIRRLLTLITENLSSTEPACWPQVSSSFLVFDVNTVPTDIDLTQVKDVSLYSAGTDTGLAIQASAAAPNQLHQFNVGDATVIQAGANLLNLRRSESAWHYGMHLLRTFTPDPMVNRTTSHKCCIANSCIGNTGPCYCNSPSINNNLTASYAVGATLNVDTRAGDVLTIPTFESDFSTAHRLPTSLRSTSRSNPSRSPHRHVSYVPVGLRNSLRI